MLSLASHLQLKALTEGRQRHEKEVCVGEEKNTLSNGHSVRKLRMKRKGWVIGYQLIIRKREGGESELGC